jgi:predicted aspartyl protease
MRILVAMMVALAIAGCATGAPVNAKDSSVPLDITTGRTMVNLALPDGQEGAFILDTGAQGPVVTQSAVDAMGLEIIGEALLGSPMGGEPQRAFLVRLDGVTLGGVAPVNRDAVVAPAGVLPRETGLGVLAPTQWADRVVTLDLSANRLWLGQQPRFPIATWHALSGRNLTEAEIEVGGERLQAHFDTGNSRGVVLPLRLAQALGLADRLAPTDPIRTVDASTPAFSAPGEVTLRVGDVVMTARDVIFVDTPMANIGAPALRGFALVLDTPNRRWGLVRPNEPQSKAGQCLGCQTS